MRILVNRLGTMLDQQCFEAKGSDADGVVEATLGLNPGLAAQLTRHGHLLPLNQVVTLLDVAPGIKTIKTVKLWD
jgi:phage tail protein X